jgi:FixJ family two-component response regulator
LSDDVATRAKPKKCAFDANNCQPREARTKAIVHVVDDDASMSGAPKNLFETVGLETQTYAAAREFLAAGLPDRPGCLVIDVRLPDINGLDFQARLSKMGIRLPVVMMTGYGGYPHVGSRHEARRAGLSCEALSRSGHA